VSLESHSKAGQNSNVGSTESVFPEVTLGKNLPEIFPGAEILIFCRAKHITPAG